MANNSGGSENTAVGADALLNNITASQNTAVGVSALLNSTNGSNNIALGYKAGYNLTSGNSNIYIGNLGNAADNNIIRIGDSSQTTTYLAGNIGLGGATPQQTLSLNGGINIDQSSLNTGSVNNALTFGTSSGSTSGEGIGSIRSTGYTDSFGLNFYTIYARRLTILQNGNVGIGTNNPSQALEVSGSINASGDVNVNGSVNAIGGNFTGIVYGAYDVDIQGSFHAVHDVIAFGSVYANGVQLTSDRNAKENFKAINPHAVLDKVVALPVTTWNYKKNSKAEQHIGPMAQDFQAAFGLNGADDKHISVVDEGGVALAAIQGLNQKLEDRSQELEDRSKQLEAENTELKARLKKLEQLVTDKLGGAK